MRRLIARELADKLALAMLQGSFSDGDIIEVDHEHSGLVFRKRDAPAPESIAVAG
jgi:ATP-dependent Clp protease ATP-binding subunit ClpA